MDFQEAFLHFIWQKKLFKTTQLYTTSGEPIVIKHVGQYTALSGPDFSEAQLYIGHQWWAGSIEMHKKSSEWYDHQHHLDANYQSVILHVVWEDNQIIFDQNNNPLATLCLKPYVDEQLIHKYHRLMADKSWIACEDYLPTVSDILKISWLEYIYIERLIQKVKPIEEQLQLSKNDWERVLFIFLFKAFGLNVNGESFYHMAQQIPFDSFKKERSNVLHLESMVFGATNLLENDYEDNYPKALKETFVYLSHKYQWQIDPQTVNFFKLRPDNFPTIRLSQMVNLYHQVPNVFDRLIKTEDEKSLDILKTIQPGDYWQTHYVFDKSVTKRNHFLSENFITLLQINVIFPIKYLYYQAQGKDLSEHILEKLSQMKKEKNIIVDKFDTFGLIINNALESQAVVHLKKHYCEHKQCLSCGFGKHFMNR